MLAWALQQVPLILVVPGKQLECREVSFLNDHQGLIGC